MKKLFYLLMLAMVALPVGCRKKNHDDSEDTGNKVVDLGAQMDDRVFKAYCLEHFDSDGDGKILKAEAEEVTEIEVPSMKISSLKGIEAFVNLEKLNCSDNLLTKLDLSKNTKLSSLDCRENLIDVIYLSEGQTIQDLQKTPFLHTPPILLKVNGNEAYADERWKPLKFEATFYGEDIPEKVTWESDAPSFQPVTTDVQGRTASLSYDRIVDVGDLESEVMYRMYAKASDGTRSNYVRFGVWGKHPQIYFEKPRQHIDTLLDAKVIFSVSFYPGDQTGTPSIKTQGEGCNRSFNNGFLVDDDESIRWNKVGEKKVIVYFENNGVRTQDTLYVNVTEGLPEIKYL